MRYKDHSELVGKHAFLGASKYSWLTWEDDQLLDKFSDQMTAQRGSELHDLAAKMIRLKIKPENTMQTFNMYVRDAIGYRMDPEQILFYSYDCFGCADAISFRDRVLRIFDLKNGVNKTKVDQLEIYAALFCLEYGVKPYEIEFDLRIYQHDQIYPYETSPERVLFIMDKIVRFDEMIKSERKLMD